MRKVGQKSAVDSISHVKTRARALSFDSSMVEQHVKFSRAKIKELFHYRLLRKIIQEILWARQEYN